MIFVPASQHFYLQLRLLRDYEIFPFPSVDNKRLQILVWQMLILPVCCSFPRHDRAPSRARRVHHNHSSSFVLAVTISALCRPTLHCLTIAH